MAASSIDRRLHAGRGRGLTSGSFSLVTLVVLLLALVAQGEGALCERDSSSTSSASPLWPLGTRPGPFAGEQEAGRSAALTTLLRELDRAVEAAGVCYWAVDATLLGLYRHRALLPYEGTAQLAVLSADYIKLTAALHDMAEQHPTLEVETAFEVKHVRLWLRDDKGNKVTRIDIFHYDLGADGLLRHPWQTAVEARSVFPLRQAPFRDSFLWAPHAPEQLLSATYGDSFARPRKIMDWASLTYVPNNDLRSESYPLVSVIIPTHARPQFLSKALELVERQDYPNVEIVIVDDSETELGADQVAALTGKGNTYIHLSARASIGMKRNIAVSKAKGDIIVHWDDDDYFREHRITAQVAPILSGEVDMTVLEHHYYFHLNSLTFFVVKRASSWGPHFGTFVYRKQLWDDGTRYPDNSMAEDYAFAEEALSKGARIRVLNNEDGKHVYVRHHNTWNFNFEDYDAQVTKADKPHFFSEADFKYFAGIDQTTPSAPPKHYASESIQWNRAELHPVGDGPGYTPTYPSYRVWEMSLVAKVGIGVGVAGGIGLIVVGGLIAYCYSQWRKKKEVGYMPINTEEAAFD